MKVAVVYNEPVAGMPDSEDVLDEVHLVIKALKKLRFGFKTIPVGDKKGLTPMSESLVSLLITLKEYSPGVIFNLIEGFSDNPDCQHYFPLFFENKGYCVTGAGHEAILTTTNKGFSKIIMDKGRIPTSPYQEYRGKTKRISVPSPWIVKPALEDASVGIDDFSVFRDKTELSKFLPLIYKRHKEQPLIIEQFLEGREFNISLLETINGEVEVLPAAEMLFNNWPEDKPRIVGYKAKWDHKSFEYKNTLRQFNPDEAPLSKLRNAALQCWKTFNLRGYARVDMRTDEKGRVFVIEINANPCIAPDSGFIMAAREAGYHTTDVIKRIIEVADKNQK